MPVKIMCAGCPKDEREPAEAAVKAALGQAAGSWNVSLVKIGRQWSVTVDGPEVKQKSMMVPDGGIKQAIQELLPRAAPSPPPRAPAPPTVAAPSAPPPRSPSPAPVLSPPKAAPGAPTPRAPLPPTRSAPTPAPRATPSPAPPAKGPARTAPRATPERAPTRSPSHSSSGGERQDRYECQFCGGAFVVIYEANAGSGQETVAVACPHCWKNSHVMVAEEAALSRDYRSEKA